MQENAKGKYTYEDFLNWNNPERIELYEGTMIMMAQPSRRHQEIVGELYRQIANFLKGKSCKAYVAPFAVRLFETEHDHPCNVKTVVEPDISVICDPDKLDSRGCRGAPDVVVEVLSPSSARNDRIVKLSLYMNAGVKEYWLVSPEEQSVLVYRFSENTILPSELYDRKDRAGIHSLPGCTIDLGDVFAE